MIGNEQPTSSGMRAEVKFDVEENITESGESKKRC